MLKTTIKLGIKRKVQPWIAISLALHFSCALQSSTLRRTDFLTSAVRVLNYCNIYLWRDRRLKILTLSPLKRICKEVNFMSQQNQRHTGSRWREWTFPVSERNKASKISSPVFSHPRSALLTADNHVSHY